ncbi:hypothetical protein POPTR_001G061301v4 [Populus trichocarpa]|uniref:Uncharacterized protein n=1 Tax=Populus trichocarpa TaxID=3694 RepID=A0ACC0TIC9_POPTR|nr:hypothetical protein POPTR_001G061301v4 [Populus trichocarpa]
MAKEKDSGSTAVVEGACSSYYVLCAALLTEHVLQKLHKLWSLVPVELVKVTAEVAKFHLINKCWNVLPLLLVVKYLYFVAAYVATPRKESFTLWLMQSHALIRE